MEKERRDSHYWLIELLAYWEGRVNASHLANYFVISRQQAQKYFSSYTSTWPDNLRYSPSLKGFSPTAAFTAHIINGDVSEYLDWLDHIPVIFETAELLAAPTRPNHPTIPNLTNASLSLPSRQVMPQIMRALVSAIKQGRRVDVDYVSLANPDGEGRIIQPHVFVKTGLRWHLRAYDEKHGEFRDFVLSRFRGEPELLDKATHNGQQDTGWHTWIDLHLAADSRLSEAQKQVIEQDYQMQNGQLVIPSRAALAQYLLQALQVNIKFHDASPEAQQLVLLNLNDIKQWLFNA